MFKIVEFLKNNPITKLSSAFQNKFLIKIKNRFSDIEQQMFIESFYCYLNYKIDEFVIDLDNLWKLLEFSRKQKAKQLLEKNFTINVDYKLLLNQQVKQEAKKKGGHNKEIIMLTIRAFKLFCLKAGTKKAEKIHEYYIKLEEMLQEIIEEESNTLRLQLEKTKIELKNKLQEKEIIREKTLLEQFPNNSQCVYYGIIDNVSDKDEKLIKFGNSNSLKNRVIKHKDTYLNFRLINAFKVENKLQIENAIKLNPIFIERQRTITIKNKKYIELLSIEDITFNELDKIIKNIISSIEYSPENYKKILEENLLLKKQLAEKDNTINSNKLTLLESENRKIKMENIKLIKRYNNLKEKFKTGNGDYIIKYEDDIVTQDEVNNYGLVINKLNHHLSNSYKKNSDGTYNINGQSYNKLYGTREEVWEAKSYKTTGGLVKDDLIMNKKGKLVSKKKCIQETNYNRFYKFGINK